MTIETLKQALPDYAKDLKLNLSSLEAIENLSKEQLYGTLLASALAANNPKVLAAVLADAEQHCSETNIIAAKAANSLMAMTNVYYRSIHFIENKDYSTLPANLRMNFMKDPGVEKVNFELYALAVSAINGCEFCVSAHEKSLIKHGLSKEQVQQAIRIAAVIHGVSRTL